MIDIDNYRGNIVYIVSIANMPILKEVVQAKNEKEAIKNTLGKYGIKCNSIIKSNSNNANCIVNDNYYTVEYCFRGL